MPSPTGPWPALYASTGMPPSSALVMGSLNSTGAVAEKPMPSGWAAIAWSIREAVFSRSNLSGPRTVTSTPILAAAVVMPSSTVHQKASQAHKACWTIISFKGVSPPVIALVGSTGIGVSGAVVGASTGGVVGAVTASVGVSAAFG